MRHLLLDHQQEYFHPFPSLRGLSCFLSHVAKGVPKAAWFQPAWLLRLGLNPSVNLPLHLHFQLLPQLAIPTSILVFFQLFWAAIVSPGRRGFMAWSQSSPSSHAGAVTKGSCLLVMLWVEVIPISLAQSMATAI